MKLRLAPQFFMYKQLMFVGMFYISAGFNPREDAGQQLGLVDHDWQMLGADPIRLGFKFHREKRHLLGRTLAVKAVRLLVGHKVS